MDIYFVNVINFMRRNILLSIITFLSLCYIITSCSTDNTDLQLLEEHYKTKPTLNQEISEFISAFEHLISSATILTALCKLYGIG